MPEFRPSVAGPTPAASGKDGDGEGTRCLVIEFFSPSAFRRFAFGKIQDVLVRLHAGAGS